MKIKQKRKVRVTAPIDSDWEPTSEFDMEETLHDQDRQQFTELQFRAYYSRKWKGAQW